MNDLSYLKPAVLNKTGLGFNRYLILSLPALLLLTVALTAEIAFFHYYKNASLKHLKSMAITNTRGLAENFSLHVRERRFSMQSLVDIHPEYFKSLMDNPDDSRLIERLRSEIASRFPFFDNFTISDDQGIPVLDQLSRQPGPRCETALAFYANNPARFAETILLHHSGNSGDFNFDILADFIANDGSTGIFFTSFNIDPLQELMARAEIDNQTLLVVNSFAPNQIEFSAEETFSHPLFGKQLNENQLNSALVRVPITDTGWTLVSMPLQEALEKQTNVLLWASTVTFLVLTLVTVLMQWRIVRKEQEKLFLMNHLENLVEKRTSDLWKSQRNLQAIFEGAPYGIVMVNARSRIIKANPKALEMLGYSEQEFIGIHINKLMPKHFHKTHDDMLQGFLNAQGSRPMGKGRHFDALRKDGSSVRVEIGLNAQEIDNEIFIIANLADVSNLESALQNLHEEHERALVTLNSIGDAVITTNIFSHIKLINPVAEKLCGVDSTAVVEKPLESIFILRSEQGMQTRIDPVADCLKRGTTIEFRDSMTLKHSGGTEIPVEVTVAPIHDQQGDILGTVLVFRDVTQSRAYHAEVEYHANHDSLTGLVNRREFDLRLKRIFETTDYETFHCLLFLDLDRFKLVNDTAGHAAGDELLVQLSSVISSLLRRRDTFARLGGDEFAIILENCTNETGLTVANKIRKAVEDYRLYWKGKVFSVAVSIGLVPFSNLSKGPDQVLSNADTCCYLAKESGRNRVQLFDQVAIQRREENAIVNQLASAFENQQMHLYQQLITPVAGQQPGYLHAEILVRMFDEEDRIVSPGLFLPAAEKFGLATTLDKWVVRSTFDWLEKHQSQLPANMLLSINLSGQSITDQSFGRFIQEQLQLYGIATASICFEITETAVMSDINGAKKFIEEIKELGCQFSLDDFGSGQASYAHLKHLPVDYLKIDGLFVRDIARDPIDYSIVKSINEISQTIGLKTIAEYAENNQIVEQLREIQVDFIQGYAIARPAPIDELLKSEQT